MRYSEVINQVPCEVFLLARQIKEQQSYFEKQKIYYTSSTVFEIAIYISGTHKVRT